MARRTAGAACECGHVRVMHQHARSGLDCGVCGPDVCPEFRRRPFWARYRRAFRTAAATRPATR